MAGFDLVAGHFCEECGHPKMNRLLDVLTGCTTCDDVITAHRCEGRPVAEEVDQAWQCPDCLAWWLAERKEDTCGECSQGLGTFTMGWKMASLPGRQGSRREPNGWQPFRNALPRKPMLHPWKNKGS